MRMAPNEEGADLAKGASLDRGPKTQTSGPFLRSPFLQDHGVVPIPTALVGGLVPPCAPEAPGRA